MGVPGIVGLMVQGEGVCEEVLLYSVRKDVVQALLFVRRALEDYKESITINA